MEFISFLSVISNMNLEVDDLLVSFDPTFLFTKIPFPDSIRIIEDLLSFEH